MINYSIIHRKVGSNTIQINQAKARIKAAHAANQQPNPEDESLVATETTKAYAVAQYRKISTIDDLCKRITNQTSAYQRGEIKSALTKTLIAIQEMLLNGEKVDLGEFGCLSVVLESEGVDAAADFRPRHHIKKAKVKWEPGPDFRDLKPKAEFKQVLPRRANKMLIKSSAEKQKAKK
ncbi:MAG: HU family DNA-binding protein [Bacteroidales bacterium]|nr:HU family DNA-binding protein [Bacteroidales bacterium]